MKRPSCVLFASAFTILGAILAFIAAMLAMNISSDRFIPNVLMCVLLGVMLVAVAGSLKVNGTWSWRFLIFIEAMCVVGAVVFTYFGAMGVWFGVAIAILTFATLIFTAMNMSQRWIIEDRA